MLKTFDDLKSLLEEVEADKQIEGVQSFLANRYPVRFVMFDNFVECKGFIDTMLDKSVRLEGVDTWLDDAYPDIILTYSKLADGITNFIRENSDRDCLLTPFSELARFYNNSTKHEFDALVSTIKSVETISKKSEDDSSSNKRQRVYIPLVGMKGKMNRFEDDSQSFIWRLKSADTELDYTLILTNGTTFGVKGLKKYTVVNDVRSWLNLWKSEEIAKTIICTSPAIFANYSNAEPDNAFEYKIGLTPHDFLLHLKIDIESIGFKEQEMAYWEQLAKDVDVNDFDFEKFFNKKFIINELSDYNVFFKAWFEHKDSYERWLLASYYTRKFCNNGYICKALENVQGYTNVDFVSSLALTIFDVKEGAVNYIEERRLGLDYAMKENVVLPTDVQQKIADRLTQIAKCDGYVSALQFVTQFTDAEKCLLINWYAEGRILHVDLQTIFPDLYHYLELTPGAFEEPNVWASEYIDEYKQCKITNTCSNALLKYLSEKNKDASSFDCWYSGFRTVRSILNERTDIDVYFWIDGLGIDWVSYIKHLIDERKNENYYLNEIHFARALLPTTTEINKAELSQLTNEKLQKIGDLDEDAHKCRRYPQYLLKEMDVVRKSINDIINDYPEKKIAIVSDHGVSYMPQLVDGYNLSGVKSNHYGRIAIKEKGKPVEDDKYFVLDDNHTMCALRPNSLCAKIPEGSGAHGGCLPEEVLVPIIIISAQQNTNDWDAKLLTSEIQASSPFVEFSISNLKGIDVPYVIYNGKKYQLFKVKNNIYKSEKMSLAQDVNKIELRIGDISREYSIKTNLGFIEDDLFL